MRLVWDVLKAKFKGDNMHISKLAYKCMGYENMKPNDIKNDSNSLKTINLILELKTRLILFNLTLIRLCNNLRLFLFKNSLFSLFPIMFHVMKPN